MKKTPLLDTLFPKPTSSPKDRTLNETIEYFRQESRNLNKSVSNISFVDQSFTELRSGKKVTKTFVKKLFKPKKLDFQMGEDDGQGSAGNTPEFVTKAALDSTLQSFGRDLLAQFTKILNESRNENKEGVNKPKESEAPKKIQILYSDVASGSKNMANPTASQSDHGK
jgi:hypothetical protein